MVMCCEVSAESVSNWTPTSVLRQTTLCARAALHNGRS